MPREFNLKDYMVEYSAGAIPGGELQRFAWPGGYAIMYLTNDGDMLCGSCLNEVGNLHWRSDIVAADCTANVDNPENDTCVQCGRHFGEI